MAIKRKEKIMNILIVVVGLAIITLVILTKITLNKPKEIIIQVEEVKINQYDTLIWKDERVIKNDKMIAYLDKKQRSLEHEHNSYLYKNIILERNVEMTYYLPTGNTCSNMDYPTEGITVAFKREFRDSMCTIYSNKGELIGYYEIEDCGYGRDDTIIEGDMQGTIEMGKCVDVFFNDATSGKEFIAKWGNDVTIVIYKNLNN